MKLQCLNITASEDTQVEVIVEGQQETQKQETLSFWQQHKKLFKWLGLGTTVTAAGFYGIKKWFDRVQVLQTNWIKYAKNFHVIRLNDQLYKIDGRFNAIVDNKRYLLVTIDPECNYSSISEFDNMLSQSLYKFIDGTPDNHVLWSNVKCEPYHIKKIKTNENIMSILETSVNNNQIYVSPKYQYYYKSEDDYWEDNDNRNNKYMQTYAKPLIQIKQHHSQNNETPRSILKKPLTHNTQTNQNRHAKFDDNNLYYIKIIEDTYYPTPERCRPYEHNHNIKNKKQTKKHK